MDSSTIAVYSIGLSVIGLIAVLVFGFLSFDRVVKTQYEHHRSAWLDDGKPTGFYWQAKESTWWASRWAAARLQMEWLFKNPKWSQTSPIARTWLRRYRLSILTWNVGVVVAAATALVIMSHPGKQ